MAVIAGSPPIEVPRQTPSSHPLSVTSRVVVALLLRETRTRFGRNKLGYLWALLEPVAYVVIFIAIREQIRATIPFGVSLVLFILTGLLTFRIFISIASRALPAISANQTLLGYPLVKVTDVITARILLETLTMLVVLVIFFVALSLTSESKIVVFHDRFAAAICALLLLSIGLGVFNAVFSVLWPTWQRIWSLIRLPMLLLSGIFYVPRSLPPAAQDFLWWNPVLHCVEWMRTATYLAYEPLLSEAYVLSFGAIALVLGLLLERIYRFRLINP